MSNTNLLDEATNEIFPRAILGLFEEFAGMKYVIGSEYMVEDRLRDTEGLVFVQDKEGEKVSCTMYYTHYVYRIVEFRKTMAVMEYSHSIGLAFMPRRAVKIVYHAEDVPRMNIYPARRKETRYQNDYYLTVEIREEFQGIISEETKTELMTDGTSMDVVRLKVEDIGGVYFQLWG